MNDRNVERALLAGAKRSREACSSYTPTPLSRYLWRRYRWWAIGAGLLLAEVLVGHSLGVMRM